MAISIQQARQILRKEGKALSDNQLSELLTQFYDLAEIVSESVAMRGSKNKSKGIEMPNREAHNGT